MNKNDFSNFPAIARMTGSLLIACVTLGFAVNFYVLADLGSDSITVFEHGLHNHFGISMGTASFIYGATFFLLGMVFARKNMGLFSFLYAVACAAAIDLTALIVKPLYAFTENMPMRILFLTLAILLTAFPCAVLIVTNHGMNSMDAVAWKLADALHIGFPPVRFSIEAVLMLTGWLLGGTVGIGSIAAVLLTGTLINLFVKLLGGNKAREENV